MRWDQLFRDLEAQLEEADRAELMAEVADRTRGEVAGQRLHDRLAAAQGARVSVAVLGGAVVAGALTDTAPEWVLLAPGPGSTVLIPTAAVVAVTGLGAQLGAPAAAAAVRSRLGLAVALRALARDRLPVVVTARDGSTFPGTIDRVGADHLDLAEHPSGERRAGSVRSVRVISFAALACVRSA